LRDRRRAIASATIGRLRRGGGEAEAREGAIEIGEAERQRGRLTAEDAIRIGDWARRFAAGDRDLAIFGARDGDDWRRSTD